MCFLLPFSVLVWYPTSTMGSSSTVAIAHLAESLFFSGVPDDILVNILCRLDEDPRDLARLACVSTRFCKLIKTVCWKIKCEKTLPLLVAELLQSPSPAVHPCPEPPGGWASLQKLLVCCPGLWHAGVLLENWDFGLDREIGWFDDFGYSDGFSFSDALMVPESIFSESGCKSLGKKKCDRIPKLVAFTSTPFAVECNPSGSATRMVLHDANHGEPHVSCDVCELDSINPCSHLFEAVMNSNGNVEGMNCENDADRGTDGKEVGMYKYARNGTVYITHMDRNENGMDSDGIKGGVCCDIDEEGINFIKAEMGMGTCQFNKTGHKLGPKHCVRREKSVSEAMNKVAEECIVREHEFPGSDIRPGDGSLASEVSEGDDVMLAVKGAPQQQICKSTCLPTLSNSDPLNLMSLETGCRNQIKEGSDLVDTHVTCATSHEKRMQEHKRKSHKRRRKCHYEHCHVTTKPWNLSREQGNKLLANRFRADSLYICDWPGCLHPGDKRMYKLFRGVFKNFKQSHVWRNLKDMQAKATNVGCAFCVCKSTWDMVTTFCLKRSIEYHDDGEPVVRAYVCENGHVAGAWTDRPMYTL